MTIDAEAIVCLFLWALFSILRFIGMRMMKAKMTKLEKKHEYLITLLKPVAPSVKIVCEADGTYSVLADNLYFKFPGYEDLTEALTAQEDLEGVIDGTKVITLKIKDGF